MKIAIFTAVCDSDAIVAIPLITSVLRAFSGHEIRMVIVDDASNERVGDRLSRAIEKGCSIPVSLIRLPKPLGFRGCTERTRIALESIARDWPDAEWVIHSDPDTLVLRPSLSNLIDCFENHPNTVCGFSQKLTWKNSIAYCLDLLPIGVKRKLIDDQIGHDFRMLRIQKVWWHDAGIKAFRNGFRFRFAGGGFYAICGKLLQTIHNAGWLNRPAIGRHGLITSEEDLIVSTMAYAAGGKILDLRDILPDFGNLGVSRGVLSSLDSCNYSLIHPVKCKGIMSSELHAVLKALHLPSD